VAYTVEGMQLIDHLSVQPDRAEQMRANPKAVYFQLGQSVLPEPRLPRADGQGAVMRIRDHRKPRPTPGGFGEIRRADCRHNCGEEEKVTRACPAARCCPVARNSLVCVCRRTLHAVT